MSETVRRTFLEHRLSSYTTTQANMLPSKYFETTYILCMPYSGRYLPSHPKKYNGDSKNIIYRSLWERKFMRHCDLTESIHEWQSEEFWIPYISPVDKKIHRYYPDFFIKYTDKTGKLRSMVIEIKPKKQVTKPNMNPKRKTQAWQNSIVTWAVNQAKWKAAREFCADRKFEFKIMTEDELGIK